MEVKSFYDTTQRKTRFVGDVDMVDFITNRAGNIKDEIERQIALQVADAVMKQLSPAIGKAIQEAFAEKPVEEVKR